VFAEGVGGWCGKMLDCCCHGAELLVPGMPCCKCEMPVLQQGCWVGGGAGALCGRSWSERWQVRVARCMWIFGCVKEARNTEALVVIVLV
jgi:hypothetical protein